MKVQMVSLLDLQDVELQPLVHQKLHCIAYAIVQYLCHEACIIPFQPWHLVNVFEGIERVLIVKPRLLYELRIFALVLQPLLYHVEGTGEQTFYDSSVESWKSYFGVILAGLHGEDSAALVVAAEYNGLLDGKGEERECYSIEEPQKPVSLESHFNALKSIGEFAKSNHAYSNSV